MLLEVFFVAEMKTLILVDHGSSANIAESLRLEQVRAKLNQDES